jgi:hypothetical protein
MRRRRSGGLRLILVAPLVEEAGVDRLEFLCLFYLTFQINVSNFYPMT